MYKIAGHQFYKYEENQEQADKKSSGNKKETNKENIKILEPLKWRRKKRSKRSNNITNVQAKKCAIPET